jgi:hypothetical protein
MAFEDKEYAHYGKRKPYPYDKIEKWFY